MVLDLMKILTGLQVWRIKALTPGEVILRLNDEYTLHMLVGGLTNSQEVPLHYELSFMILQRMITHKAFGAIPGVKIDALTVALVESANISGLLNPLSTVTQLPEVNSCSLHSNSFRSCQRFHSEWAESRN